MGIVKSVCNRKVTNEHNKLIYLHAIYEIVVVYVRKPVMNVNIYACILVILIGDWVIN